MGQFVELNSKEVDIVSGGGIGRTIVIAYKIISSISVDVSALPLYAKVGFGAIGTFNFLQGAYNFGDHLESYGDDDETSYVKRIVRSAYCSVAKTIKQDKDFVLGFFGY